MGGACVLGIEHHFCFSICNDLLFQSKHFKMGNRNNFIKAIKNIKPEDIAHRKTDLGTKELKVIRGQQ